MKTILDSRMALLLPILLCWMPMNTTGAQNTDSRATLEWVVRQAGNIDTVLNAVVRSQEPVDLLMKLWQTWERFDAIAAFADIGESIDRPVKTYSSGMQMRLAFSVAAHTDPDILIIDESLAVGDAAFVQKCMRFLRRFTERGTLLFVSHDMASVKALCHRAIWLDRGQLMQDGQAATVGDAYLASLYGHAPQPSQDPKSSTAIASFSLSKHSNV